MLGLFFSFIFAIVYPLLGLKILYLVSFDTSCELYLMLAFVVCELHTPAQAHTCFNTLVLPEYTSKAVLITKLQSSLQHTDDGLLLT